MWTPLRMSRNFSITTALRARTPRKRSNPGIGHQLTAFNDAPRAMEIHPEGFDDMESDFANVHELHRDVELEHRQQRDKLRQFVVKNKYFPSAKLPNFLTYAEKEQIRILHNRDEEQWSVEVLADSFPANCEIIRKVLKANWKTSSLKRIQSHDSAVSKNWELLQQGELNNQLSKDMQEHLRKFIGRINLEQNQVIQRVESIPISNEFSSLLTLGSKQTKTGRVAIDPLKPKQSNFAMDNDEETYLLEKIKDKKHIRLEELKRTKLNSDQELEVCNSDTNRTGIVETQPSPLSFREKFTANEIVIDEADKKRYEISSVKDRIYIPRKLRRDGATYRIDDCYYDDDGEFLYRVPGMTAGSHQK